MRDKQRKQILDAFLVVMRPIVRILLRYGIGYREFLEVTKTVYVDIGSTDFGLRGRPTNISRIAAMTGITRKEVRRLRNKITSGGDSLAVRSTPISDVLHHWYADEEFTDSSGRPKMLPFYGDSESFSSLVKRFGGDIPAGAMRTEMKRVGAIEIRDDGSLNVVERSFKPSESHDTLLTSLIHAVYPVLSSAVHNTGSQKSENRWTSRVAYTKKLKPSEKGRFRRIAKDRIIDFAESIDDIFIAYESIQGSDSSNSKDMTRSDNEAVAVGVFYFEEHDRNARYEW